MKVIISEEQHKLLEREKFLENYFSIQEYIDTVQTNVFSIETLASLKSFNQRLLYCKKFLTPINISGGSSRAVFAYEDDKVIKLAKNKKGLGQNYTESDAGLQDYSLIPIVYDYDENHLYLIVEKAKPLKSYTRFEQLTGVKWKDMEAGRQYRNNWDFVDYIQKLYVNDEHENQFIMDLVQLIMDYNYPTFDFLKLTTYGEVTREGHTDIVALDYGLTNYTWVQYYS